MHLISKARGNHTQHIMIQSLSFAEHMLMISQTQQTCFSQYTEVHYPTLSSCHERAEIIRSVLTVQVLIKKNCIAGISDELVLVKQLSNRHNYL